MSRRARWIARVLDNETVRKIAPGSWVQWRKTTEYYRGIGYKSGQKPPYSGDLLVQSPYADWFNLTWGLAPSHDMPKYRWMYRARPEIRRGVDTKVILAVGRGFSVVCENDEEVEVYVNRLLNHLNIRDILQSAVTDMLVYGQAYFEKVRVLPEEKQAHEAIELAPIETTAREQVTKQWSNLDLDDADAEKLQSWVADQKKVDSWLAQRGQDQPGVEEGREEQMNGEGELIELKPLDPLWMRINRDAFNNILGFVQWGLTPIPQSIFPDKIVFLKWLPKSWSFESAYGTSILMPVQRHISLLIQAEEDMKIYWHQYAKPMLVVKAGTPDKPYPLPALSNLQTKFSARGPNTDAIVPGDVSVDIMKAGTGETTATFKTWSDYLREKIYETIGIPSVLMNMPSDSARATSDVSMQGFIAEERMIEEIVGEQFLKQVIDPEVRRKFPDKYKADNPPQIIIIWPPVLEEDRNRKMDRIVKAVGVPLMTINEGRAEAGLKPLDGAEYDEIAKLSSPGPFGQKSIPEDSEAQRTGPREEEAQKRDRDVESAR